MRFSSPTTRFLLPLFAVALLPLAAGAQELPTAKALMDKHNAALGGKAMLDKYTSMQMTAKLTIAAMGMEATLETYRAKPNLYLQKTIIAQIGEVLQGYDGKVAWGSNPMGGAQILEGEALESAARNADFFANFQDPTSFTLSETVELADFEGRKCYKVKVAHGDRVGAEYFDAGTGLLAGFSGETPGPQGKIETTTIFAEYADFGGVKMPRRIEQRTPQGDVSIVFTAVEFDKVDPAVFTLPAAVKALIKP